MKTDVAQATAKTGADYTPARIKSSEKFAVISPPIIPDYTAENGGDFGGGTENGATFGGSFGENGGGTGNGANLTARFS